jgi:hypothetical protein
MDVDGKEEEIPTCEVDSCKYLSANLLSLDSTIEAPPSLWPQKHYCDITGLEVSICMLRCLSSPNSPDGRHPTLTQPLGCGTMIGMSMPSSKVL